MDNEKVSLNDIPKHCRSLVLNLRQIANTQCNSQLENMLINPTCFELCSALEKTLELGKQVYHWPNCPIKIKELLGLPARDAGIDYIDRNCTFAGQSKLYQKGSYVGADDINRTRLCMLHARDYSEYAVMDNGCEIATPDDVKLVKKTLIPANDVYHKIIPQERMEYWYNIAINLQLPDKENKQDEPELRKCQIEALKNIQKGRINRIKLACGSGKSRIAKELIMRKKGQYLILVPYLNLLEQWIDYLRKFEIDIISIGTGYKHDCNYTIDRNKITVILCVYDSYTQALYYESKGSKYQRKFKWVIIDEAHHIENKQHGTYGEIWKQIQNQKSLVLLSASLKNKKELHYNYTLRDAINDKICVDYDIVSSFFNKEPTMRMIAEYISMNGQCGSILAFCNSIKSTRKLVKYCLKLGIPAESISSEDRKKDRISILERFANNQFRVLASVNTIGEGLNLVNADTCLFAEARSSEISVTQCIGRVVRKNAGKDMAHIIICTDIQKEDHISSHPIVKILKTLANDDYIIKDVMKKSSNQKNTGSRIYLEIVRGKEEVDNAFSERGSWIKDELYNSDLGRSYEEEWMIKFKEIKQFNDENGRLPGSNHRHLQDWVSRQRCKLTKGKLTEDRKLRMDSEFPNWLVTPKSDEQWNNNFEIMKIFVEKNSRHPWESDGSIGIWLYAQRSKIHGSGGRAPLTDNQKERMNATFPGWLDTMKTDAGWNTQFKELKNYVQENGKFPESKQGRTRNWLNNQRNRANGIGNSTPLTKEQINKLNSELPGWNMTIFSDEKWTVKFEELIAFVKINNVFPKRKLTVLGIWFETQKNTARRKAPLNKNQLKHRNMMDKQFPGWRD